MPDEKFPTGFFSSESELRMAFQLKHKWSKGTDALTAPALMIVIST
jgi:hypothetical protein